MVLLVAVHACVGWLKSLKRRSSDLGAKHLSRPTLSTVWFSSTQATNDELDYKRISY